MIGSTYEKLTVISEGVPYFDRSAGRNRKGAFKKTWNCQCECGNLVVLQQNKFGKTSRSCRPCANKAQIGRASTGSRPVGPAKSFRFAPGEAGFKKLIKVYKYWAFERDKEWSLSDDQFRTLTKADCTYCGSAPKQVSRVSSKYASTQEHGNYTYNGIDRWNNTLGYTPENCVSCCGRCNTMKMHLSGSEFINAAAEIAKFTQRKDAA